MNARRFPTMQVLAHERAFLFAAGIAACYVCMFGALGLNAQPMSDDFYFSNAVAKKGFLDSQLSWYNNWTGRYASTAIISAIVASINLIDAYWLVPIGLVFLSAFAFSLLFSSLGDGLVSARKAACAGLILLSLYFSGLPSPAEAFFWLAGGVTYQGGIILFCLLVASLFVLVHAESDSKSRKTCAVAGALVILVGGMNETILFLQVLILTLAMIMAVAFNWRQRRKILFLFIVSICCAGIVMASPGNQIRSQHFLHAHDFMFSVVSAYTHAVKDIAQWVASFPLWIATLISLPLMSSLLPPDSSRSVRRGIFQAVLVPFLWTAIIIALYFPAFWSMGAPPPARAESVAYFWFLGGWFISLAFIFRPFLRVPATSSPVFLTVLIGAFGYVLFCTDNGSVARADLVRAPAYHDDLQRRYELIRREKARNNVDILVPVLREYPTSIFVSDITVDKDHWKNAPYAEYFSIRTIATTWKPISY